MIKKLGLLLLLVWGQQFCFAQFSRASLQATGLTCALCSKAIHQALEKIPFVQKVSAQLKESGFEITNKPDSTVDPAQIRTAVEEAGFFVGALYLTLEENAAVLDPGVPVRKGDLYFEALLSGKNGRTRSYQVLNEHFLTEKSYSKLLASPLGDKLRQQPAAIEGLPVFYLKSSEK